MLEALSQVIDYFLVLFQLSADILHGVENENALRNIVVFMGREPIGKNSIRCGRVLHRVFFNLDSSTGKRLCEVRELFLGLKVVREIWRFTWRMSCSFSMSASFINLLSSVASTFLAKLSGLITATVFVKVERWPSSSSSLSVSFFFIILFLYGFLKFSSSSLGSCTISSFFNSSSI